MLVLCILIFVSSVLVLHVLITCFNCYVGKVHVSELQLFYVTVIKFKIRETTVKIGLLPISSGVSPKGYGYCDEDSPIEDDDFRAKPLPTKLSIASVPLFVYSLATVVSYSFAVRIVGDSSFIHLFKMARSISIDSFTGEPWQIAIVLFVISATYLLMNCVPMTGQGLDQIIRVLNDKYRMFLARRDVIADIISFVLFAVLVFFFVWLCM